VWQEFLQPRPQQGRRNLPFLAGRLPTAKIYSIGESGTAVVENLADGKVIASIPMGGGNATRSSIAVSDGHLFIRTSEKLVVHREIGGTPLTAP